MLAGPPHVHQPQHDGPVDTDKRSVVHAVFAPDARSIAVATVGGPPVVVRTPVAKYKNTDLARCALGVDDATHVDMSRCGGYIIASGGTVAPQIFPAPGATTRHVDAPACRLPSGASGFRFYYLDRFVVGPDGGNVVLDAVALDANPDRCRAKRVHRFSSDAQRVECVACLNDRYSPLIVAAASDKAVRVLDAAAGRCAREIADAHARPPHALAAPRSSRTTSSRRRPSTASSRSGTCARSKRWRASRRTRAGGTRPPSRSRRACATWRRARGQGGLRLRRAPRGRRGRGGSAGAPARQSRAWPFRRCTRSSRRRASTGACGSLVVLLGLRLGGWRLGGCGRFPLFASVLQSLALAHFLSSAVRLRLADVCVRLPPHRRAAAAAQRQSTARAENSHQKQQCIQRFLRSVLLHQSRKAQRPAPQVRGVGETHRPALDALRGDRRRSGRERRRLRPALGRDEERRVGPARRARPAARDGRRARVRFITRRPLWRKAVETEGWLLITEDDCRFDKRWTPGRPRILWRTHVPSDAELVYLGLKSDRDRGEREYVAGSEEVFRPTYGFPARTAPPYVTPPSARRRGSSWTHCQSPGP